jgi:hypothetical protein
MNGRHFILLGIVACAGLVSVHDGQQQVELCYQIGGLQKDLREVRAEIGLCRIRHRALQSPRAVTERAAELQLKVGPVLAVAASGAEVREPGLPPSEANRSLGKAQGEKPPSLSIPSPVPHAAQKNQEQAHATTPGAPRKNAR